MRLGLTVGSFSRFGSSKTCLPHALAALCHHRMRLLGSLLSLFFSDRLPTRPKPLKTNGHHLKITTSPPKRTASRSSSQASEASLPQALLSRPRCGGAPAPGRQPSRAQALQAAPAPAPTSLTQAILEGLPHLRGLHRLDFDLLHPHVLLQLHETSAFWGFSR